MAGGQNAYFVTEAGPDLLDHDEAAPFAVCNPNGRSPFLLLGDHAGNAIPRVLGTLGLSPADRARHIAWDIGVRGLGELLATSLDATFIHQPYSRLVIDCNRDPVSDEAVPAVSDCSCIPGNDRLAEHQRKRRIKAIHQPYHDRIAAELARRAIADRATVVIALHSFAPAMAGIARPWDVGVLYADGDTRFAMATLGLLDQDTAIIAGDNQPYWMDETDHTILRHAVANGLPYVELEIRQDLIAGAAGQRSWCERLTAVLNATSRGLVMNKPAGSA